MSQSWRLPCPQTSGSTNRSRAGQCRARPMTGRPFAPVGFDFTLSALFFHFPDWPATFLLALRVDDWFWVLHAAGAFPATPQEPKPREMSSVSACGTNQSCRGRDRPCLYRAMTPMPATVSASLGFAPVELGRLDVVPGRRRYKRKLEHSHG